RLIEFAGASDESVPAGSPSLTLDRAIEFLHEEAGLIGRQSGPATSPGIITSFWIEDLLAVGDVLWPGAMDDIWQSVSAAVAAPKLLVSYQRTPHYQEGQFERPDPQHRGAFNSGLELWKRIAAARYARTRRRGIGPVLWLNSGEPTAAKE